MSSVSHRGGIPLRRRSFLALSAATAVGALVPLRTAAAATGDAEIVVIAGANGTPYRTVRYADGTYAAYQPMALDRSNVRVCATTVNGQEFVEYNVVPGLNRHAVRQPDGTYTITDSAITDSEPAAVAGVNGELHLVGINQLTHAIRHADGTWSAEGYVEGETGTVGAQGGAAIAGDGGRLHVVVLAGRSGVLHTIRHENGTWDRFGDVVSQAGDVGFQPVQCAAAVVNGELHLVVLSLNSPKVAYGYSVRHTIRHADGTWDGFGLLVPAVDDGVRGIAAGSVNGELFLLYSQGTAPRTVLRIRHADGTWADPEDIQATALDPANNFPARPMSLSPL